MAPRWTALFALATTGCIRAGATEVHVRDLRAVGVVADRRNEWLLSPGSEAARAVVYDGLAEEASVERTPSGSIQYVSEHRLLQTRRDVTPLVDRGGLVSPAVVPGIFGPLGGPGFVMDPLRRAVATEIRVPIVAVKETGPFGTCTGQPPSCEGQTPTPISLATRRDNIAEVDVVRTPVRPFGWFEVPIGIALCGVGGVGGAVELANRGADTNRTTALAVDGAVFALGGALVANGLWYLLARSERTVVYQNDRRGGS